MHMNASNQKVTVEALSVELGSVALTPQQAEDPDCRKRRLIKGDYLRSTARSQLDKKCQAKRMETDKESNSKCGKGS